MSTPQEIFVSAALNLKLIIEAVSVIIIVIGLVTALYLFIQALITRQKSKYLRLRIILGRFLVVALEFQLAADIVGTAVAPSWDEIGKLAATALIRTFLNYFLDREIRIEEKQKMEKLSDDHNTGILEK